MVRNMVKSCRYRANFSLEIQVVQIQAFHEKRVIKVGDQQYHLTYAKDHVNYTTTNNNPAPSVLC